MGNYLELSTLMSTYSDVFILRSFSGLNVKNLLYYQAELAHLEQELKEIEHEDQMCEQGPRQLYATDWKSLGTRGCERTTLDGKMTTPSQRDSLQWQTFLKIREVLDKYSQ
jgi:hypothetical protein